MPEVCTQCGLPKELCVCETIAKESQAIRVSVVKKKFGKVYTQIRGIDGKEIDTKNLVKELKSSLACGGTIKDSNIELQGDHRQKVKKILMDIGFAAESIVVE